MATFLPELYDDAARLPGRRGAGLGAMTAGMRLSAGAAIAIFPLPSLLGLTLVNAGSERRLRAAQEVGDSS